MGERNDCVAGAQLPGNRGCASVENKGGPSARCPNHLNIPPANASLNACSQRFGGGFLGCKTRGKAFRGIAFPAAIKDFVGEVDSLTESISIAGDNFRNPRNFDHVQTATNNHFLHGTTTRSAHLTLCRSILRCVGLCGRSANSRLPC